MDEFVYTKALKYLSRRPRSEYEVRENLKKKKVPENQIPVILSKLREQKLVNDYEFAKWWIEQRNQFRPKGWYLLAIELQQKGVSQEIISHLKLEVQNDNENSETELARKLVQKNLKKFKDLPRDIAYQKLGGYLARRGFKMEVIKACIDDIFRK